MGQLDQFAKQIFEEETEGVTHGGVAWQAPPPLNLSEVRLDGMLLVRDAAKLHELAAPWSLATQADELVLEIKMPGDHLDMAVVRRALLRRQAREVQRAEDPKAPWDGEESLWIVAPHVPASLTACRKLQRSAPGCYRVEPASFPFLWIAANELPLADELIPFLIARSGKALDEFARWVKGRRSYAWLLRMIGFLPMSTLTREEVMKALLPLSEDPEIRARTLDVIRIMMNQAPGLREEIRDEGRLTEARAMLRDVLEGRGFTLRSEDEARIESCADLVTIHRWHKQAIRAASIEDALR